MSAPAAVTLRRQGAPDLLVAYADAVAALPIGPDARRLRRNAAGRLLAVHPQLAAWMRRPTPARLADLKRTGAWPFLTWCFIEGHLLPDLDLLLAKTPGDLYKQWAARHPGDVQQVTEVAQRFGWSANWTRDVTRGALALVCLTAGKALSELGDDDFAAFARALAGAPTAGRDAWMHNSARVFSLHQACYELRICQHPPRQARPGQASIAQRVQAISQPGIRAAALRYLTTVAATLRPNTVSLRADSLIVFSEYLAAAHPDVRSLTQLTREHIEGFLAHNHKRPWRGRLARDQPVSAVVSKRTVIDLRCFLDDLALWGWAERPPRRLLFPADIPRLDRPLPRALPPDADRDLIAAVSELADPFARTGLTVLRGTGIRLGELLDLELDCIWDSASHGSWLKVPLGKLAAERTVPLDEPTLAALDEWMTRRGPQRALPHPRLNRPADFLFTERGRRLGAFRLRRGLDDAVAAAGLRGRDGQSLRVTPHQLRHTYATNLEGRGVASDATFRAGREEAVAGAAALPGACWAVGAGAGHAAGLGFVVPGCTGWQDVASGSVVLADWLMRPAHGVEGAGMGEGGRVLALVAADGSAPVSPGAALLEEMLAGWRRQQQARRLTGRLIGERERVVRQFAEFTGCWPWQWTAAQAEAWLAAGGWAHSTARSYQGALALFLEYVCDPRYGWVAECEQRAGAVPVQVFHERNSAAHVADYEGRAERRPLTRAELQAFFDAADDHVEKAAGARRKGWLAGFRDATLFKVVYGWGLGRREAAMLDVADFTPNPAAPELGSFGVCHVRFGKAMRGSPPRRRAVATVMPWAAEALAQYLQDVRPRCGVPSHPALWLTERGERISPRSVDERFAAWRQAAGLPRELSVHCLRHSYVSHLIEDGADPLFVQQQAGHSWASTTAAYTTVGQDARNRMLRAALARAFEGEDGR